MQPTHAPRLAYILVWFPKPSETFVFREVCELRRLGLPVDVFTLYGPLRKWLTPEMAAYDGPVHRTGLRHARAVLRDILWWRRRNPAAAAWVLRQVPWRRWRTLETAGEALLACLCGFHIARRCLERDIDHIHADWATGAATAAWVAARLTGLPFSFTGRAADIHPPDGALAEKGRDCAFIRTDVGRNVDYLIQEARVPASKVKLVYAAMTMTPAGEAPLRFEQPYRLLGLGRFVEKKGFDVLLRAVALLRDQGLPCRLTLAGAGPLDATLKRLAAGLGLSEAVRWPGFVSHQDVPALLLDSDVFVMPSQVSGSGDRDGIPNVIMEALAHRVPVVATDVAGIAEVVRDGETGALVPQKDAPALAAAIARLLRNRPLTLSLAERGRELVLRTFDPGACARALADLFSSTS